MKKQKVFATSTLLSMTVAILFCLYIALFIPQIDPDLLYLCAFFISILYIVILDELYGTITFILVAVMYFYLHANSEYMSDKSAENDALHENSEIVVARYKENLDWLGTEPFSKFNHVIYNKGSNNDFYTSDKTTAVINLPNVGKCDHTYLYHIIENYDNLKDITIFLPGSVTMEYKIGNATSIINSLYTNKSSTAVVFHYNDVATQVWDFTLDTWKTSDTTNHDNDVPDNTELAKIRPFGEWYRHHFGDLVIDKISLLGIMAISRKHIHNHPKSYYKNLISELDKSANPEVGHFFERAWMAVFHPMDDLVAL